MIKHRYTSRHYNIISYLYENIAIARASKADTPPMRGLIGTMTSPPEQRICSTVLSTKENKIL